MTPAPSRIHKHSLVIAGHGTSISLEAAFWDALRDWARERGVSVAALVAEVDAARGEANLSSALRVRLLEFYREKAAGGSRLFPKS
jgi:predicted DNA-binding ribbon-helix-helix protein